MTKIKAALQKIHELKPGRKAYLTVNEEALVVIAAAEMKGCASQPVERKKLASQLNEIIDGVASQPRANIAGGIKYKSQLKYAKDVIKRVNKNEP
jgi:hypothetical protein